MPFGLVDEPSAAGNYPETGLEEINGDLREADFWPAWLGTVHLLDCS
jgi:hypothetical protein